MALVNYHTHTFRCDHATGDFSDLIEEAIKHGFSELGFSEHGPLPNNEVKRLKLNGLDAYLSDLAELKRRYSSELRIHAGLEVEYFPEHDWYHSMLRQHGQIDYLILGQHLGKTANGWIYAPYLREPSDIKAYVELLLVAMKTGYFDLLAHPDLWVVQKDPLTVELSERVIQTAIDCNLPLELNAQGLRKRANYPRPFFWEMVASLKAPCVVSSDAHSVKALCDDSFKKTLGIAERLKLNVVTPDRLK